MSNNGDSKFNKGDIVQFMPTCANPDFAGMLLVVTETRSWGVVGYVHVLGREGKEGGLAYYRAGLEEFVPTGGQVVFMPGDIINDIIQGLTENPNE